MEDTDYDEASRHLAKQARGLMMHWLLQLDDAHVSFGSFMDSVLTRPNTKERIADAVAHMTNLDKGVVPFAAIVEFQTVPDPKMFGRLLVAGGICWLTVKPTDLPGDRYELTAVVVNFTGVGNCASQSIIGAAEWTIKPHERNLSTYDAGAVLADIIAGRAPRQVVAWIPVMKNATDPANMQTWQDIFTADTDLGRRGDYALAVIFAALVGTEDLWRSLVESLTMNESPVARAWRDEARREGERKGQREGKIDMLVLVLRGLFKTLPQELEARIRASTDNDELERWADLATTADSIEKFRQDAGI